MKKQFLPAALIAAVMLGATAAAPKGDPTVMTINGKDISQSEFEYLYNKNNLQQENPQPLDEYVDMFVVYKLKVADAEAAGIDTTASFVKELDGYCADISAPYLVDTIVRDRLISEAWGRMQTMREVSHIMLPMGRNQAERDANRQRLDSIRTAILNGADFAEMARKFSSDRSAVRNGGNMGVISAGKYPYPFEKAAYNTPIGEVSEVVDDAPYGWHIIKPTSETPHPGLVSASHILKMTQGLTEEEMAVKKAEIDSIYDLLQNGAVFEILAMKESDDPGSAQKGGKLGKFGPGMMVAEFEQQAYALPDGGMSKPFLSPFGYHIVKVDKHMPLGTLEDNRKQILSAMARDGRINQPRQSRIAELQQKWGFSLNQNGLDAVRRQMEGVKDNKEAFNAVDGNVVVGNLPDGGKLTAAQVCAEIGQNVRDNGRDPYGAFERQTRQELENETVRYARGKLSEENPDFKNLVNEYRDGILLFEISNRKVWDRSNKDTEALKKCFEENRSKYTWDKPRFKGCVILATSDSTARAAKAMLETGTVSNDSLVKTLTDRFGRDIKIERVLTAKGDNKIVDEIAFEGPKAEPVGKWTAWFPYDWKVISTPEEASDVKAAVSSDLQQQLEADWVKELRSKYKVKLNKKALKKLSAEKK